MKNAWRGILLVAVLLVAGLEGGPGPEVRAQSVREACTSFVPLVPDVSDPLTYTVPIQYGTFADVELGTSGRGTVELQVEAFQDGGIQDRRTWILIPGRVLLLTEVLDVKNLFEVGSPLVLHLRASAPVAAILVRRD